MAIKCPKCGIKLSDKKAKTKNLNLLALSFLFGTTDFKKNKNKKICDVCGSKITKEKD